MHGIDQSHTNEAAQNFILVKRTKRDHKSNAKEKPIVDQLKWVIYLFDMELLQFSDAVRLTQLSESQLRDWCGKRGLFQPTVPARGSGRVALFSWQDVISLRIFREIFSVFGGRASSWSEGIRELRENLDGQFFPNLWGKSAIFTNQNSAAIGIGTKLAVSGPALIVPLDPHLNVISDLATPEELQGQLPLITQLSKSK